MRAAIAWRRSSAFGKDGDGLSFSSHSRWREQFELAADQNLWYSYRYALCGIMIGLAVSAAIVLVRYLVTRKEV